MAIETIQDWNNETLLGGGDPLPEHSSPRVQFEGMSRVWYACGWNLAKIQEIIGIYDFDFDRDVPCPTRAILYRRYQYTPEEEGDTGFSVTVQKYAQPNQVGYPNANQVEGFVHGPANVGQLALSSPLTWKTLLEEAEYALTYEAWGDISRRESMFWKYTYSCGGKETDYPAQVLMTNIRYRMGIPEGYATPYLGVWWDEVFYPKAWLAWEPIKARHDRWKESYDLWLKADPSTRGDKPVEPELPGAEPKRPSITKSRDWTYAGSEFSGWFIMNKPVEEGTIAIRNLRSVSYRSPWGTKPYYSGDRWRP